MSSPVNGHGGSDSSDSEYEILPNVDGEPSSSLAGSLEGEEALRNYAMALDLLKEQKREKDRQIEELKQENGELKDELREFRRDEREQMNQRIESLQSEKQVIYTFSLLL